VIRLRTKAHESATTEAQRGTRRSAPPSPMPPCPRKKQGASTPPPAMAPLPHSCRAEEVRRGRSPRADACQEVMALLHSSKANAPQTAQRERFLSALSAPWRRLLTLDAPAWASGGVGVRRYRRRSRRRRQTSLGLGRGGAHLRRTPDKNLVPRARAWQTACGPPRGAQRQAGTAETGQQRGTRLLNAEHGVALVGSTNRRHGDRLSVVGRP